MSASLWDAPFLDPLHGRLSLSEPSVSLARTPALQRLRHVRLSNIDSLDIPAIANLSRFEHVLGVAHLAGQVGFRGKLDTYDTLVLDGSALLHDWAITSFGHLVEEGLQYVGASFDHESRLSEILNGQGLEETGGNDLQIFMGRTSGMGAWARRVAGSDGEHLLRDVTEHIRGRGRMGRVVAGDIDLDNVDNVFRMAFHMGLDVDRKTPTRISRSIVDVTGPDGEPVFRRDALLDIQAWRNARREVYQLLMLSGRDMVGKIMLLFATVRSHERGELHDEDWKLVDDGFMARLLTSGSREVRETAERWSTGELWDALAPRWIAGRRPDYPVLRSFSDDLSEALGRTCFAYGIKDKRDRRIGVSFEDGTRQVVGVDADQWLLGIASAARRPFSKTETRRAIDLASERLGAEPSVAATVAATEQASLF